MVAFLTKKLMVNTDFFWWHFLQKFSSNGVIADSLLSFHDFGKNRDMKVETVHWLLVRKEMTPGSVGESEGINPFENFSI